MRSTRLKNDANLRLGGFGYLFAVRTRWRIFWLIAAAVVIAFVALTAQALQSRARRRSTPGWGDRRSGLGSCRRDAGGWEGKKLLLAGDAPLRPSRTAGRPCSELCRSPGHLLLCPAGYHARRSSLIGRYGSDPRHWRSVIVVAGRPQVVAQRDCGSNDASPARWRWWESTIVLGAVDLSRLPTSGAPPSRRSRSDGLLMVAARPSRLSQRLESSAVVVPRKYNHGSRCSRWERYLPIQIHDGNGFRSPDRIGIGELHHSDTAGWSVATVVDHLSGNVRTATHAPGKSRVVGSQMVTRSCQRRRSSRRRRIIKVTRVPASTPATTAPKHRATG